MFSQAEMLSYLAGSSLAVSLLLLLTLALGVSTRKKSAAYKHAMWMVCFGGILLVMSAFLIPSRPHLNLLSQPELLTEAPPANPHGLEAPYFDSTLRFKHEDGHDRGRGLIFWIWLVGMSAYLLRYLHGLHQVHRLARRGSAPSERLSHILEQVSQGFDLKDIQLVIVREPITPMTWGWRRSRVLLPPDALDWSDERLEMVLGHELSHIARRDFQALVLVQLLCAFHWFNPLIWVARRRLVREREMACDDMVLERGALPSDYADHLLDIASGRPACYGAAGLCMSRISELEGRLLAILAPENARAGLSAIQWTRLSGLFFTLVTPIALFSPWQSQGLNVSSEAVPLTISSEDQQQLEAAGISRDYLAFLEQVGYRDLDAEQIQRIYKVMPDTENLQAILRTRLRELSPVTERNQVCMRADQVIGRKVIAIEIEGSRYFAMAPCTTLLLSYPHLRVAVDPFSGKPINKADGYLGATDDGRYVYYFENRANLENYNKLVRSVTKH